MVMSIYKEGVLNLLMAIVFFNSLDINGDILWCGVLINGPVHNERLTF